MSRLSRAMQGSITQLHTHTQPHTHTHTLTHTHTHTHSSAAAAATHDRLAPPQVSQRGVSFRVCSGGLVGCRLHILGIGRV